MSGNIEFISDLSIADGKGKFHYMKEHNQGKILIDPVPGNSCYIVDRMGGYNIVCAPQDEILRDAVMGECIPDTPDILCESVKTVSVDELLRLSEKFSCDEILALHAKGVI